MGDQNVNNLEKNVTEITGKGKHQKHIVIVGISKVISLLIMQVGRDNTSK